VEDRPGDWAASLPRASADRLRALAMPAVLVAIASLGVYRSATLDQSSWQGASFGMFATYDNRTSRTVAVTLVEADGARRVTLPEALRDDATRLTVVPTDGAAETLAREVLARADDATAVVVEVQRLKLDADDGLRITTVPIASGEVRR